MKNLKVRVMITYYENGEKLIQLAERVDFIREFLGMLKDILFGG